VKSLKQMIRRFLHSEDGATAIEYGLIAAGLSIAIAGAMLLISEQLLIMWELVLNAFQRD
jgi:pilus assembly protein Flp/PilA